LELRLLIDVARPKISGTGVEEAVASAIKIEFANRCLHGTQKLVLQQDIVDTDL